MDLFWVRGDDYSQFCADNRSWRGQNPLPQPRIQFFFGHSIDLQVLQKIFSIFVFAQPGVLFSIFFVKSAPARRGFLEPNVLPDRPHGVGCRLDVSFDAPCCMQVQGVPKGICVTHCNTLQRTTTHCNTLQHTATHCNTLQHTATYHLMCQVVCRYKVCPRR